MPFPTFFFSQVLCTTQICIYMELCPSVFHSDLDVTQVAVYLSTDVLSYPQKWTCFNCGILRSASYCTRMLWDKESFKSQICSWTGILSVQIQAWIILFHTMLCGDVCMRLCTEVQHPWTLPAWFKCTRISPGCSFLSSELFCNIVHCIVLCWKRHVHRKNTHSRKGRVNVIVFSEGYLHQIWRKSKVR